MVEVIGLNEVAKIADKEALRKRIEKDFLNEKVAAMVAQGVEKALAKVMVKAMWESGVYNC